MNKELQKFKGLGVAVVTPFLPDGSVDFKALESLVEHLIEQHVDYLVALGTTSEYPTIAPPEKEEVLRCISSTNAGRLPLLVGVGGPNTNAVLRRMDSVVAFNPDAILSVTPYYNNPSQAGLLAHYQVIAEHSPLPIFLYNVPGRTSCNLKAETTLRIAESCPNVWGVKEASGNMHQILYLLNHKPEDFLVISGDDLLTLPLMAAGMDGLISVVANAYPAEVANMVHLALADQYIKARIYHDKLFEITRACFKEGNPCGVKAFLAAQGRIHNVLRLPLVPVSEELQKQINNIVNHA
ncbi:MAG: 4-hydroxy-tetrahydrodipicolinate synthase [Bacteroidales bacterium]|nr:4-hydroxy-tetrahydrodipicolinate synthase [Bacteroidales bacterium]